MKMYVKTLLVLIAVFLYNPIVNAQSSETYGWEQAPRYRGFISEGNVFGTGDVKENRTFFSTSHGIQINPELFIGGGVAVNYWWDSEYWSLPLFVDTRVEFHKELRKNFSPYISAKVGYSVGDCEGLYFAPQVGCHFYFGHSKFGLSTAIGYTLQNCKIDTSFGTINGDANGIELTVGLDI